MPKTIYDINGILAAPARWGGCLLPKVSSLYCSDVSDIVIGNKCLSGLIL